MEGVVESWVGGMVDDGKGGLWMEGKVSPGFGWHIGQLLCKWLLSVFGCCLLTSGIGENS